MVIGAKVASAVIFPIGITGSVGMETEFSAVRGDSTLESLRIQFSIFRKMGIAGRARVTFELCDVMRAIVESGVRLRHPDYDENAVRLAVIRLTIGRELFCKCYPGVEARP